MNTSQNKSAQNQGQTQAQKLNPDFSHRLSSIGQEAKHHLLSDAVSTACLQAENTLSLMSCFFIGEIEAAPSDELIYWTLDGVIQTIKDINAIVNAYVKAQKNPVL